ncbi:MAG: acyl-ACP--UDP-N-acetylglucosamine O-acyltransferase [Gemmatimonadales bacterium]|nr:MAG: acyl-ACP--UDP-N-acetylglucosamine O-acyltransferase [Gemmatimonadales bacterium]
MSGQVGTGVEIHETAIVDSDAELASGVRIGPRAIIGPGVRIGEGTEIGAGVLIEKNTEIGRDCRIFHGAVLGSDPQDLKFQGEESWLRVGDRTMVREYATLNRGTSWSGQTVVGSDCLLMAYVHVAHDCHLGNHVIVSNATQMAGHVSVGDWVIISGLVAIHQFVRIGAHAFVGGASRIAQDAVPYCRIVGNPPKLYGLNSVGLDRRGFSPAARSALKRAYRLVFKSDLNISQGVERARAEIEMTPEVTYFLEFIESSERGVTG